MLGKLLPRSIDNAYGGHPVALWLLGAVALMRILQSASVMANGRYVVAGADGIPLGAYPPDAAQTIVALFGVAAVSRLIVALFGALALFRYRSAVPLALAALGLEHLGREAILRMEPIARTGSPIGPTVNLVLFALAALGFVLSLLEARGGSRGVG